MTKNNNKLSCQNIPMLDGNNFTVWRSQMKRFLQGKKVYFACVKEMDEDAPVEVKANYLKAKNEAISYIVAWINKRCYNKVIDKITVESPATLWTKISNQ